jgi:uncharacterized RDD family membrane protein YckC
VGSVAIQDLPPAGLFRRLAALFYDGLLLTAVLFLATALLLPLTGGEAVPRIYRPLYHTYLFFITFFYFAWHWVRGGQTLGMKAWHLMLVQADGKPLTWWHALLRFMLALPSGMFFGLGFVWVLFDGKGQTWHDRLADTRVVRLRPDGKARPD